MKRLRRQNNRRLLLLNSAAYSGSVATRQPRCEISPRLPGILSGSIYYHFASKEEMLVAVYEEGVRRITARVDAAIARNHLPWERLTAACVAHLEALLNRGDYAQVVVRVLPRDAKSAARQLIALRDRYEVRFRRLIDELRPARNHKPALSPTAAHERTELGPGLVPP